jgi:predicted nucleic-acid-binding Zn-ribbon protein
MPVYGQLPACRQTEFGSSPRKSTIAELLDKRHKISVMSKAAIVVLCDHCGTAYSTGLEGGLETVQAAFKEFSNNAIKCPKCGHVVRWGEAKLQAQQRQS